MSRLSTGSGRCKGCGARVAWAKTQHGKMIPLDPEPVPDGNIDVKGHDRTARGPVLLVDSYATMTQTGRASLLELADEGRPLYQMHASCPHFARGSRR